MTAFFSPIWIPLLFMFKSSNIFIKYVSPTALEDILEWVRKFTKLPSNASCVIGTFGVSQVLVNLFESWLHLLVFLNQFSFVYFYSSTMLESCLRFKCPTKFDVVLSFPLTPVCSWVGHFVHRMTIFLSEHLSGTIR